MSEKCINLADIDHSIGCDGNMPGIVPQLIYGFHDDVASFPDEPEPVRDQSGVITSPLALADAGALVGDLVMKPQTRAYTLDFTEDVGSFRIAPVGETDGLHFNYELSIIKAKIQKTILGFMNASANRKMFFVVQDENGLYYLMGSKNRGANLVSGGDGAATGTGSGDRNQVSLSYTYRAARALVYEGDVENILVASVS
jgi:hypothetical protein